MEERGDQNQGLLTNDADEVSSRIERGTVELRDYQWRQDTSSTDSPRHSFLQDNLTSAYARGPDEKKTAVSPLVCSFFLLNMLLGSGPLTLPYAFNQAGLALGSIFVIVGAFIAYISATFLIEYVFCKILASFYSFFAVGVLLGPMPFARNVPIQGFRFCLGPPPQMPCFTSMRRLRCVSYY
jgi:hypothetical protein